MSEPFLGEIKIMSFAFAPRGWALCNGQVLPIDQHQALYHLLGTTFGGDGQSTFALPDLQGRTPIHAGSGHTVGESGGEQAHTLSIGELPSHRHVAHASSTSADAAVPAGNLLGAVDNATFGGAYASPSNVTMLAAPAVGFVGSSEAHENMQPYLTFSFCIALQGILPADDAGERSDQ